MLRKVIDLYDKQILYEYFKKISLDIPYYFPVSYDLWHESMFNENDDGVPRFAELETYLLYEKTDVKGFIQYGLTNPVMHEDNTNYALIRNMHYAKDSKNPESLMESAFNYFKTKEIASKHITAYYHRFGMWCYARHGKLHESQFYIEDLLEKYSFINNEENVYFSKDLSVFNSENDSEIVCEIEHENSKGMGIKFILNGEQIGVCGLSFLHSGISYLGYLETFEKYRGRGLGERCMNNVFYILKKRNINRIDTDTYTAADFYTKIGMTNKGITRSYRKDI